MKTQPQPSIFVRMDRCMGCHSCELACAVAHSGSKTLVGAIHETSKPLRRIFVEAAETAKSPILCRHCEDAPCVGVCPTRALASDPRTHAVQHTASKCIGCALCAMACPFGVIQQDAEARSIVKCDLCQDRARPACVEACPTRALQLQPEYEKNKRQEVVNRFLEALHMGRSVSL